MSVSEKIIVGGKKASDLKAAFEAAGLRTPETATIMVTGRCNLHCRHCWPESGFDSGAGPVSKDRLLEVIAGFASLGCQSLCLAGGEPLTHPEWLAILSDACRTTGFREISLQTNATLITAQHARKLASLQCDRLVVQISMEGASDKTHDEIRGKGTFVETMRGVSALNDFWPGRRLRIAFTETCRNFEELPALLEFAEKTGVEKVVSGTLVSCGRAAADPALAPPDPEQYLSLLSRYEEDPEFKVLYERRGSISGIEWFKGRATPAKGFCDLAKKPYVTAEGLLHPCLMFHSEKYAGRGVFERDFADVLYESIPRWVESKGISEKRPSLLRNECGTCEGFEHCKGGCMGRAFALGRDPMAREDRCSLRRAVYEWKCSQLS